MTRDEVRAAAKVSLRQARKILAAEDGEAVKRRGAAVSLARGRDGDSGGHLAAAGEIMAVTADW